MLKLVKVPDALRDSVIELSSDEDSDVESIGSDIVVVESCEKRGSSQATQRSSPLTEEPSFDDAPSPMESETTFESFDDADSLQSSEELASDETTRDDFPIENLPDIVHEIIFSHVPIRDRLIFRIVCKRWDSNVTYANKKQKTLAIIERPNFDDIKQRSLNTLCDLDHHFFGVNSILVLPRHGRTQVTDHIGLFKPLMDQFPQLIAFHCDVNLLDELLDQLTNSCPMLEHISVTSLDYIGYADEFTEHLPKLSCINEDIDEFLEVSHRTRKYATISDPNDVTRLLNDGLVGLHHDGPTEDDISSFCEHGENLRQCGGKKWFLDKLPEQFSTAMPNLKFFVGSLQGPSKLKWPASLTGLQLSYKHHKHINISRSRLKSIFRKTLRPVGKQLKSLSIKVVGCQSNEFAKMLGDLCPNLEVLELTMYNKYSFGKYRGSELYQLRRLKKLRRLQINCWTSGKLDRLRDFLNDMPQLRVFNFGHFEEEFPNETQEEIKAFKEQFSIITFEMPFF